MPPFIQGHITLNEAPSNISTFSHRRKSRRHFSLSPSCTLCFNKKIYELFSNYTVSLFEFEASTAKALTFSMITPSNSATRGDRLKSRDPVISVARHLLYSSTILTDFKALGNNFFMI